MLTFTRLLALAVLMFVFHGAPPAMAQGAERAAEDGLTTRAKTRPVPRLMRFSAALAGSDRSAHPSAVGVTFAIYADQSGGAPLWMETQNVSLDSQARYSVLLGAASREGLPVELFASGEARWLGVQVQSPGETEQARILLVSVPYAMQAADAATLGGRPATDYVLRDQLNGWSGAGVQPSASSQVNSAAAGGSQPVVSGTVNFIAKFTPTGADLGNSQLFDNGTNVGIGTSNPSAQLDVQVTTGSSRNALNTGVTLNNSSAISNAVISALNMQFVDASTANNLSKQAARMVYIRDGAATGGVLAFDSIFTTSAFLNANAPYILRGANFEFPRVTAGRTLSTYYGLYMEAPQPANGTVTNSFAMVTEPGAGNVGINTTAPLDPLHVVGVVRATGGIRFADGSLQTTAGGGGGTTGDVTDVLATVGGGITVTNSGGPQPSVGLITSCAAAQILKWAGSAWECAADAGSGDITAVITNPSGGLQGGVGSGDANLSLLTSCNPNQILKWTGTSWGCANDNTTSGPASDLTCTSCVSIGELDFDPTTQTELEAHRAFSSTDHDARYDTRYSQQGHGHDVTQVSNAARTTGSNTFTSTQTFTGSIQANGGMTGLSAAFNGNIQIPLSGNTAISNGIGVYGLATNTTGSNFGVEGESQSSNGVGVYGYASSGSGPNRGVLGRSNSTDGAGVVGETSGTAAAAVIGNSTASSGSVIGVKGVVASNSGFGVRGVAPGSGTTFPGSAGVGVMGEGTWGVVGIGGSFPGVFARNNSLGDAALRAENMHSTGDLITAFSQGNLRFVVDRLGNLSIGSGTTGCVADRDGTVIAGACASDLRLKTAIKPILSVLPGLIQLRPVTFTWRTDVLQPPGKGESFGLVAQDVERVFPQMVTAGENGYKAVRYNLLPFLLLQAIRELEAENQVLRAELAKKQKEIEARLQRLENTVHP